MTTKEYKEFQEFLDTEKIYLVFKHVLFSKRSKGFIQNVQKEGAEVMGYIKREDAIETIREYLDPSNERTVGGVCFNDGLDLAITLLSKMPAADVVERKRGKWLFDDHIGEYYCSSCKYAPTVDGSVLVYSYCPKCGTEMEASK